MKIKEKMVELKNKGVRFIKEHEVEIKSAAIAIGTVGVIYLIGRRDGKIEADRHWGKELNGKVVVDDDMMGEWLTHADHYYGDGTRNRRYFDMFVTDKAPDDDIIKVTDLGKIGDEMVGFYKDKLDISDEQVTHMMIITDPETGK